MQNIAKPLISVIMPTYNRADTIRNTVESVLKQTYSNLEVIIIDDASCDNTEDVIANIKDSRVVYMKNWDNMGANASRNIGILRAEGEYISFIDSADEWDVHKLEKQLRYVVGSEPPVDIVFCSEMLCGIGHQGEVPNQRQKDLILKGKIERVLAEGNCIDTPTLFCRKTCFAKAGLFDVELPRLQDYEWAIRAVQKCRIAYMDECLVKSVVRPDSISSDVRKLMQAVPMIYDKHHNFIKKYMQTPETFLLLPINILHMEEAEYLLYESYFRLLYQHLREELYPDIIYVYQNTLKSIHYECKKKECILKNIQNGYDLNSLIRERKKFNIFGAGKVAGKLWNYLTANGFESLVEAVVVTSRDDNKEFENKGILFEVENCNTLQKKRPIVLAVSILNTKDIVELLKKYHFENIVYLVWEEIEMTI